MKSKTRETTEQAQQRIKAEADNTRSMQDFLQQRTTFFQRLRSPRVSIATGRAFPGTTIG